MHEWALAESVVKTVEGNEEFRGKRVKILLGELQNIDKEIFEFALKEIMKMRNSVFDYDIEDIPVVLKCRNCGFRFSMKDVELWNEREKENVHFVPEMIKVFARCPKCRSADFDIVEGRGIGLTLNQDNDKDKETSDE